MKYLSPILLMSSITIFTVGCSSDKKEVKQKQEIQEIVVFDDGYKTSKDGALIIDDQDYDGKIIAIAAQQSEESVKKGIDDSQIKIMYDGFGNKTISRMFHDHPLVAGIVTRISANGVKKAYLYTKDGLVKEVSGNVIDMVETASGNEIANQTGIFTLQENIVYNPKLAEAEAEESKSSVEVINADYQIEIPNQNEPDMVMPYESTLPNKEASSKSEAKKDEQIVSIADNTFIEEFDEKEKSKNNSVSSVKKKD